LPTLCSTAVAGPEDVISTTPPDIGEGIYSFPEASRIVRRGDPRVSPRALRYWLATGLTPGGRVQVTATDASGKRVTFPAVVRLNSAVELDYYRHGGILQRVLRQFAREGLKV